MVVLHVVLKLVNVTEHSSRYATITHVISNHIVWLTDSGMPRTRQRQRTVHVQRTVITTQCTQPITTTRASTSSSCYLLYVSLILS